VIKVCLAGATGWAGSLVCPVYQSAADALAHGCDVFVEFTKPDIAKRSTLAALSTGAHVVAGTSGLIEEDY
jgi:4-hydroxy-tetrahydrodipicolinate reductase